MALHRGPIRLMTTTATVCNLALIAVKWLKFCGCARAAFGASAEMLGHHIISL